jgi:hypothetical protein
MSKYIPSRPGSPFIKVLLIACLILFGSAGCDVGDKNDIEDFIHRIINALPTSKEVENQSSPVEPTPLVGSSSPGSTGGGNLKPVCFLNTGTIPATVMAWTYIPLNTESPALPSDASTVASPGGNPSACLSLPLGTYTWCYHWELGDINKDGMIEYAHALDERPVVLDESDTDDLDLAEKVILSAPADIGLSFGVCGMDISQYVVAQNHADNIKGALINMGHDGDSVSLRGPITIIYWYIYNTKEQIFADTPREYFTPEMVVIPAGETWTFVLVDGRDEHPGDWNVYIWLVSVDE